MAPRRCSAALVALALVSATLCIQTEASSGLRSLLQKNGGNCQSCLACSAFTGSSTSNCYAPQTGGCLSVTCSNFDMVNRVRTVTVSMGSCRNSFGWACCSDSRCGAVSCGGGKRSNANSYTCEGTSGISYRIPFDMDLMPLEVRTRVTRTPGAPAPAPAHQQGGGTVAQPHTCPHTCQAHALPNTP